ncbi:unnamed protein product [Gadus morhua 'NCC']
MPGYRAGRTAFWGQEHCRCRCSDGESGFWGAGTGAQGTFSWREKQFGTEIAALLEDAEIAASLEDATEEGAEIAASLEDAEIAASLEDAAEDDTEIAASLEDAAEEDAPGTAGLQQLKPASQPERSSGKRKAKSRVSQAGAKTWRRTRSLERSGALAGDESEIDFNEYQEVTTENVQQPVQRESVEIPGKFVREANSTTALQASYRTPSQLPRSQPATALPASYRTPSQILHSQPATALPASYRTPSQIPHSQPDTALPASYRAPSQLLRSQLHY